MQVELKDLPQTLLDIIDVIGLQAALALVEALGGVRVYVPEPEHLTDGHTLVRTLGMDKARKMAKRFGGEPLVLPRCVAAMRTARNNCIREERCNGDRPAVIALRHGLTERQVYSILAEVADEPSPQQSLL